MGNLSWKIGDVTVTRVVEAEAPMPARHLLPQATREALAPHREWLAPFTDAEGRDVLSIHALVIEAGSRRILVDTCLGEHVIPGFEMFEAAGRFPEQLAAAGFPRESIDTVLCTHLHFDHVGWNTMRDGDRWVPTFPNARYLFARTEWEHWSEQEPNRAYTPTFDESVRAVVAAGLADFVETDHRVCEEVWLEPTPGHTPGHVSVRIASRGLQGFITGDMTHHPVQWAEPGWAMSADTDPAEAAATRRRVIAEHADVPTLVIGTHYPSPTAGHLVRGATGVWFRAKR